MTPALLLHLVGSLLLLALVRTLGADDPVTVIGWACLLGGLAYTIAKVRGSSRRYTVISLLFGILALALMVGGQLGCVDALGLEQDGLKKAEVVLAGLWPLMWLCATFTLLSVERVRAANPIALPDARSRLAALAGLSTALALACLLPLNYLAHENNERWDHSYFKTATPGTSTQAIVENLANPVRVYLFFPHTSDVTEEIRTYFDQLEAPNLDITYADQALEGELAKKLKVQKNGTIALVRGEGEDAQIQRIRIGVQLDKARRKLKRLDEEVHKSMLKIVSDARTVYVTAGHGEMYWKRGTGKTSARLLSTFKKELRSLNFRVKELGPAQGLANEVPEGADLVIVMGPTQAFLPEEIAALQAYAAQGGSLLVALDPRSEADLSPLLADLGLAYEGKQLLVGEKNIWIPTRRITDKYNLITNKASTHPSVTTLSRQSRTSAFLAPVSAPLTTLPDPPHKVDITLRTLPEVFLDVDGDLRFDPTTEKKKGWPLAAAIAGTPVPEGEKGPPPFRAIVIGDATWASDMVLGIAPGNKAFVRDSMAWLVDEPGAAGTINDEEDVKIQHTREGEGWMFYGVTFLVPFGLLGLGLLRVRMRRMRGAS